MSIISNKIAPPTTFKRKLMTHHINKSKLQVQYALPFYNLIALTKTGRVFQYTYFSTQILRSELHVSLVLNIWNAHPFAMLLFLFLAEK